VAAFLSPSVSRNTTNTTSESITSPSVTESGEPGNNASEKPGEEDTGDINLQKIAGLKEEAIELMNAKKFDEALKVINKAIEIDPRDDLLSKRADIYISTSKYKKAEKDLKEALEVSERADRKALIYGQLADVYNEQGEDEKSLNAIKEFEKLEAEQPAEAFKERPGVYGTMGTILADNGEYDRAIKCFNKALEKEPGETQLVFERGYAYYHTGDKEKAKADMKEWLNAVPSTNKDRRLRSLANAYMILEEYDKGLKYINEAMAKEPGNFSFYNDRAYIYILKGDKEAAKKDLETVEKKYPDKNNWERKMAEKLKGMMK